MRYLLAVFVLFFSCGVKASSYDLPFEVLCDDVLVSAQGGLICPTTAAGSRLSLKVKIPPTRGQLRVLDCEQELTADGNPDDFNTVIEKTGWWLWRKTVRKLDATPVFPLPIKDYTDCPVVISVTGEDAGVQTAALVLEPRAVTQSNVWRDFLHFSCDGDMRPTSKGVGFCRGFEGARVRVRLNEAPKSGKFFLVGTSCGINQVLDFDLIRSGPSPLQVEFTMPEGICLLDAGLASEGKKTKSRVMLVGEDRGARKLDNPVMVLDGKDRRVYKPQGAKMVATEIYLGQQILWRSGVRKDESFVIRPGEDNGDAYKSSGKWPQDSVSCHTAYTDVFDSMSGSCYDLNTMREVPYFFR